MGNVVENFLTVERGKIFLVFPTVFIMVWGFDIKAGHHWLRLWKNVIGGSVNQDSTVMGGS